MSDKPDGRVIWRSEALLEGSLEPTMDERLAVTKACEAAFLLCLDLPPRMRASFFISLVLSWVMSSDDPVENLVWLMDKVAEGIASVEREDRERGGHA